jgi:hypothetical protein
VDIVPGARHVAPLQSTDAFVQLVGKYCRVLSEAPRRTFAGDRTSKASCIS